MKHPSFLLRRWARSRRGAVAAEFALITPIFTAMMFAIIEYGTIFFAYGSMQASAQLVARQVAANVLEIAEAPDAAKARLPAWVARAATVTATQTDPANPLTNRIHVIVRAPVTGVAPLAAFTWLDPWTMSADVWVNQELPYED